MALRLSLPIVGSAMIVCSCNVFSDGDVRAAIEEGPAPLRASIVLHDYQGLDHREVAEVLHIAHDAARKRYSRALAALELRLRGRL